MDQMTDRMKFVARRLVEIGAVRFSAGGFRLAIHEQHPRAPRSPFYLDLRLLRSYPRLLADVAGLMVEAQPMVWNELECVGDVPEAATPMVTLISQRTGISMISPRFNTKDHGIAAGIIGAWQSGQSIMVIDDLRTTGGSSERVAALFEASGLKVKAVMAFVDRGDPEGAPVAGWPFISVFKWSRLLAFYRAAKLVPSEFLDRSARYPAELAQHLAACQGCV
ncbi:MAG: hypothetical protein HY474_00400 [Candidatus Sungbacteria bacterium]|uniref:Orotate phosphoribosyltransferase n=1 Tax=Candidatus Sungiibacteriota bacterium TaxID=2750080 RepID=A0A932YW00_9BACT|nr:hypothetical protein [Candidatus Sungbacteria bacterium]